MRRITAICLALAVLAACETPNKPKAEISTGSLQQSAARLESDGEYAAAAERYRTLVERQPNDRAGLLGLARNLRYSGNAGSAIAALEKATGTFGDNAGFLLELGKAKLAVGDANGAIEQVRASIAKDADDWDAHASLAIANDLLQNYGAARRSYNEALALSPDNPAVLNNLAISLALSGDIDAAIQTLEGATREVRNNPQVRQNLALFYGIRGDMEKARGLARMDLNDASVIKNMAIYSKFRAPRGAQPNQ